MLLDTVALYRAATEPDLLSPAVRSLFRDPSNELLVSLVSAWELAIKSSLGKLALPCDVEEFFAQGSRDLLAQPLGLELNAIARVAQLPLHHRDPFDRLIISQALIERCAVVTTDVRFASYGIEVIW